MQKLDFNPRTREGCDYVGVTHIDRTIDFNPRTREGCDGEIAKKYVYSLDISIHAPVKGATRSGSHHGRPLPQISIHAPVKGATLFRTYLLPDL